MMVCDAEVAFSDKCVTGRGHRYARYWLNLYVNTILYISRAIVYDACVECIMVLV